MVNLHAIRQGWCHLKPQRAVTVILQNSEGILSSTNTFKSPQKQVESS